jgi:hypothetical protein
MARSVARPEKLADDLPAAPVPEPLPRTARSRVRDVGRWLASPAFRTPAAVFVLTRVLFLLLTYFGLILYSVRFQSPHPSYLHALLPSWNRWDTWWYINIAQRGYGWHQIPAGTRPTAFFPLYPLLLRAGVAVTHRSYIAVALAISNLCFLAALLYLWRLARWEFDREVAGRTVLYVSVFPTALFFFAGYTESLFLFLTVASFYHLRRQDWLLAGTFGAFASTTRVAGVLLLVPFLYEYAHRRNFAWRRVDGGILGLVLIPLGLLAFMLYLKSSVGDAFAFTHSQVGWEKVFTLQLWAGFVETVRQIVLVQPPASFFQAHNILNAGIGGLFLIWSFLAARRLPPAYTLYTLAFWLVTLSSPALANGYPVPLVSLSRYVLVLFPVFMYVAILGARQTFHDACLVLSVGLLSLLTVQFIHNGWIV